MDKITPTELEKFSASDIGYCISIIMEASPLATGSLENSTKLKYLLNEVKEKLSDTTLTNKEIEEYLKSSYNLSNDPNFWRDKFNSLLIYIVKGKVFSYKLPLSMTDQISISRNCNLLPLIKYEVSNIKYNLLVLDEGGSQLFSGDNYSLQEITSDELKISKKDLMKNLEIEEEQFYHVEKAGDRSGRQGVIFHGHGNEKDDKKLRLRQLLKHVLKVLDTLIIDELPLILVGHKFITEEFMNINKKYNVIGQIQIDVLNISSNSLIEMTGEVLLEQQKKLNKKLKNDFCDLSGTGRTLNNLDEIIKAAIDGKISELLVENNKSIYGTLEIKNNDHSVIITNDQNDEELINLATFYVLKNSGSIHFLDKDEMPEKDICAILRY